MKKSTILIRYPIFILLCLVTLTLYGNKTKNTFSPANIAHSTNAIYPILEISDQSNGPWSNNLSVTLENRLSLWYKITLNDTIDNVRIVFPIYDNGVETSIGEAQSIMTLSEWSTITLEGIDPDDYRKNEDLPGVIDLNFLNGKQDITFQLSSRSKLSTDAIIMSDGATCSIQRRNGRKWKELGEITISKKLQVPSIVNFSAQKSVLIYGERPLLSWTVVDADGIEILERSSNRVIHTSNKLQSSWTANKPNANIEYLLRAKFQSASSPDKELPIKLYEANIVATIKNQFDGQHLMGLYNHPVEINEKMIALVRHKNLSIENVLVWESIDGLIWEKSSAYSKIPAFIDKRNLNNVPLEFAASPGVVYRNKLYLIGGSRSNPNFRSNEIYFYDFGNQDKGWQKGSITTTEGKEGFSPRMGHNCVVYNDDIWILGGSDYLGATNECWIYDGKTLKRSDIKLPNKKCMASAMVVDDQIQIFGGFGDLPGVPDQTYNDAIRFKDGSWSKFTWSNPDGKKYSACAVAPLDNSKFIFSTNFEGSKYISNLDKIERSTFVDVIGLAVGDINDSYYNIQTVTFKGVVWICRTTQNGSIQTADIQYLVYVN